MTKIATPKKTPRPADSYRQNGRAPRTGRWGANPRVFKDRPYRGPISLNRSQNRRYARSYAHAREISPSAEVVR
jgi:hypothetical protein